MFDVMKHYATNRQSDRCKITTTTTTITIAKAIAIRISVTAKAKNITNFGQK